MPYLVIGPCLVNLEAGVKPCLHCDGPDAGKTRAVEGETSVHQAAAGTAGHPLYLADGLQWRYLRRAIAEGADVVKFFGLNHEICGRGSVAEYFYILGRWASLVSSWWCA